MSALRVGIMGAAGRMGRELIRAVLAEDGCDVEGGIEAGASGVIGTDLGILAGLQPIGKSVTSDAVDLAARADALLDFTTPAASVDFAGLAASGRLIHVIGTTGFSEADEKAIAAAARHATIIKAGNMSLGVNLLAAVTRTIAKALDEDFDIEIVETHHRHKVDAPSGTALMLGTAAAEGRGIDLQGRTIAGRNGHTGARKRGDIGFASLRGGDIVGEHTVIFCGLGERIEISHKASDRAIFARGAVKAALWGRGRGPGLYSMADVLGV